MVSRPPDEQSSSPLPGDASSQADTAPQPTLPEPSDAVAETGPPLPEHAARPAYHRVLAPDLARGFMLLFIALANIPWYLHSQQPSTRIFGAPPGNVADAIAQFITVVFIDARSFPMFAFLFGYGMVQFYRSRLARGLADKTVRGMLQRRHLFLFVFGAVHFLLLFEGDVLAPYGVIGLILVAIFFRRRDKTILIWALIGYGLLLTLTTVNMVSAILMPDQTAQLTSQAMVSAAHGRSVTNPDYLATFAAKPLQFAMSQLGQVFMSPFGTMMMLGWLAARRRYLENAAQHTRLLRRVAIGGLGVAWVIALPVALTAVGVHQLSQPLFAWAILSNILGCLGGLGYIALFALLAVRWQASPGPAVQAVANVGARSLSSYLLQSVIFAPLLCAWGFNLGQDLGRFPAALIAIGTWLIGVAACWWLAQHHHRGPAETLLRRLTYGAYR